MMFVCLRPALVRGDCVNIAPPIVKSLTPRDVMARYDLVFTATVIQSAPYSAHTLFDVDRVWKGDLHRYTSLLIPSVTPLWARPGQRYLMLMWVCHECAGPKPIYDVACTGGLDVEDGDVQNLLKRLGAGRRPRV